VHKSEQFSEENKLLLLAVSHRTHHIELQLLQRTVLIYTVLQGDQVGYKYNTLVYILEMVKTVSESLEVTSMSLQKVVSLEAMKAYQALSSNT